MVEAPSRWRLRRRAGTRRPSSRHSRWTALRLTTPALLAELGVGAPVAPARMGPAEPAQLAAAPVPVRLGSAGWRWVVRCCPTSWHAHRCDTPNTCWRCSTARRRRAGLTSFPGPAPSRPGSGAPCRPRSASAGRSRPPAPSGGGRHQLDRGRPTPVTLPRWQGPSPAHGSRQLGVGRLHADRGPRSGAEGAGTCDRGGRRSEASPNPADGVPMRAQAILVVASISCR